MPAPKNPAPPQQPEPQEIEAAEALLNSMPNLSEQERQRLIRLARAGAAVSDAQDELQKGKKILSEIALQLNAANAENARLRELGYTQSGEELAPEDVPIYEIGDQNYYSPDDIYYPEGAQFEDLTGTIIPNENMIPLNVPAEERMAIYLESLPSSSRTPPIDLIIQAAMELRPKEGDDPKTMAENNANVMRRALEKHYRQLGVGRAEASPPRQFTQRRGGASVPLMPNTRIGPAGAAMAPMARGGPARTRLHADAVPAALKSTNVMGGHPTRPLGHPQAGGVRHP